MTAYLFFIDLATFLEYASSQQPEITMMNDPNLLLIEAAGRGDMLAVRSALDAGADVNAEDDAKKKLTALSAACRGGYYELAEALLLLGANPNVCGYHREANTPLIWAAIQGNIPLADLLLAHGAEVDFRDSFEWTPLHNACYHGQLEMVRFLLAHGADPHAKEDLDRTTLMYACHSGRAELVRLLLEHGVDPLPEDLEMCDALLWVEDGEEAVEIAKMLVAEGLTHRSHFTWLYCTPFLRAVCAGKKDLAAFWLEQGSDIDDRSQGYDSAVSVACMQEKWDMVPWLLERGAECVSANDDGYTPLVYAVAAEEFRPDIADLLLQHGARVNVVADETHILAKAATPRAREWLLAHGCSADADESEQIAVDILRRHGVVQVDDAKALRAELAERADSPMSLLFFDAVISRLCFLENYNYGQCLASVPPDAQGRNLLMRQCALPDSSAVVVRLLDRFFTTASLDSAGNSALWYALKCGNLDAAYEVYSCRDLWIAPEEDGLLSLELLYGCPPAFIYQLTNEGYYGEWFTPIVKDGLSVLDRAMLDAHAAGQRFLVQHLIDAGARRELLPG